MAILGNGTTVAMTGLDAAITVSTLNYTSIGGLNFGDLPAVEDVDLSSTGARAYLAGATYPIDPIELSFWVDPHQDFDEVLGEIGTTDTMTISFAEETAAGNAATFALTGFLTGASINGVENDARVEGTIRFQPDGGTVSWTAETDA